MFPVYGLSHSLINSHFLSFYILHLLLHLNLALSFPYSIPDFLLPVYKIEWTETWQLAVSLQYNWTQLL